MKGIIEAIASIAKTTPIRRTRGGLSDKMSFGSFALMSKFATSGVARYFGGSPFTRASTVMT